MKVLFIGGTGNISTEVSKLAVSQGIELYLLNRGTTNVVIPGAKTITANIYDVEETRKALKDHSWDVVVNWIAFIPDHVQNDIDLFMGKTKQYIFISSASIYQKPPTSHVITESTPIVNPFWGYSRDKIKCEELLQKVYQEKGFPMTIVRPSHTYDKTIPISIGGWTEYTAIDRMKKGKKVIIHGDGTSLWTLTNSADFAKGFNGLLGNNQAIGHAIQITSDEVLNWNQIYQIVAETAGAELNAVHVSTEFITKVAPGQKDGLWGDKAHCAIFDNSKIKSLVPTYQATIPFREGFKRTLDWFEADPKRMVVNPETNAMMDRIIEAYESAF
ncbi:MAG: NAD-dependent epimerase/dehydratase family protein [Balneolaceae bacterium]|nr:NAD-dependent epimerase/dehydratase family protein [Balneolaceae bacterium]MBO6547501.1 NAD-dependent epimerase/dehydratase family protein [Balneolaceae bacterium]MBO6647552.1 NAD-dependent epimerase/dehydratase family protein [Balneolaceae bacterium]